MRKRFSITEAISLAANVVQLAGWGFPLTLGSAGAAIAFITGLVAKTHWFLVVVGAPVCGLALVLLWALFVGFQTDFDGARYAGVKDYPVWIAAWLWIEMPPLPVIPAHSPAWPVLTKLKEAIKDGSLPTVSGTATMNAVVSAEALRALALTGSDRPRFLFPKG